MVPLNTNYNLCYKTVSPNTFFYLQLLVVLSMLEGALSSLEENSTLAPPTPPATDTPPGPPPATDTPPDSTSTDPTTVMSSEDAVGSSEATLDDNSDLFTSTTSAPTEEDTTIVPGSLEARPLAGGAGNETEQETDASSATSAEEQEEESPLAPLESDLSSPASRVGVDLSSPASHVEADLSSPASRVEADLSSPAASNTTEALTASPLARGEEGVDLDIASTEIIANNAGADRDDELTGLMSDEVLDMDIMKEKT